MSAVIEGWVFERDGHSWLARSLKNLAVTVELSGGSLLVSEATRYYPGGDYEVPLSVIDNLKELAKE